jgi:hypothetical protein
VSNADTSPRPEGNEGLAATGGCLCGAVRYEAERPFRSVSVCHCRSCRLASGAPMVAWFVLPRSRLRWLRGAPRLFASSPPVERGFCGECGTQLTYANDDAPDDIEVTTLSLDEPGQVPPTKEIWLSERVAWVPVNPLLAHDSREGAALRRNE